MNLKRILIITSLFLITAVVVVVWLLRDDYHDWRIDRFVGEAEESLRSGQVHALDLMTTVLLDEYPDRLETMQFFAKLSDAQGDGAAIYWRQRILEIRPDLDTERLALGLSYIRLKQFESVAQLLHTWPNVGEAEIAHLKLKGAYAFAQNDTDLALSCSEKLYALDPNTAHLLNLAKAELRSDNDAIQARGKARLLPMVDKRLYGGEPGRVLLSYLIREERSEEAQHYALLTWRTDKLSWDVRFALLEAATLLQFSDLEAWREETEKLISETSQMRIRYGAWLLAYVGADTAVQWFESQFLDYEKRRYPDALPYAEALMKLGAEEKLIGLLKDADWRNREYLRYAILARVSMNKGVTKSWGQSLWENSLKKAERAPDGLYALIHVLRRWGWSDFERDALMRVRNQNSTDLSVYARLNHLFEGAGDESGLLENARLEWRAFPQNVFAKNNYLYLSILLGQQTAEIDQLARESRDAFPENPFFRATYAYSLLESAPKEALGVMNAPASVSNSPGLALTWALILLENRQVHGAQSIANEIPEESLMPTQLKLKRVIQSASE